MNGRELGSGFLGSNIAIAANLRGISPEESRRPVGAAGNPINWIAGHILLSRDDILAELGQDRLFPDNLRPTYRTGSPILTPDAKAMSVDLLRDLLERSSHTLMTAVTQLDRQTLLKELPKELFALPADPPSLGAYLIMNLFHEAYHAGQLGIARRAIGKESGLGF